MGAYAHAFGPHAPEATYIPHKFEEQLVDVGGGVSLNYVRVESVGAGSSERPALLLIPGQTESWWGYEKAMPLLVEHFQVFAVDLRGQGRSHEDARPLHARQHGQRPRPLHRRS